VDSASAAEAAPGTVNDDDALMARVRAGDARAFASLVEKHEERVRRFLERMLASSAEAEDVCQDVFVEVWRTRDRYEARGQFVAWLFRIARSRAASRGRFLAVRRFLVGWSEHEAARTPTTEGTPADHVLRGEHDRQRRRDLDRALLRLPHDVREAVVLRHTLDVDYRALAAMLGVSEGALRVRVHRGLAALRAQLDAEKTGEAGEPGRALPGRGGAGEGNAIQDDAHVLHGERASTSRTTLRSTEGDR
jgi:RNA polymerase sigma-70 factor (ECF subfamily)